MSPTKDGDEDRASQQLDTYELLSKPGGLRMNQRNRLSLFPWATLGRIEGGDEFFRRCEEQAGFVTHMKYHPTFLIMLEWEEKNQNEVQFQETIESLILQSYPHWRAVVLDRNGVVQTLLDSFLDPRITCFQGPAGLSECEKLNLVAHDTDADWLGVLTLGEVLSPTTLYQMAVLLQTKEQLPSNEATGSESRPCLMYTNEVMVDSDSKNALSFFSKCAFSWFDLVHANYIGRFWMVAKDSFSRLGGLSPLASPHEEYDFLLRLSETGRMIRHLPHFLCYRRERVFSKKTDEVERTLVEAHLKRKKFRAKVIITSAGLRVIPELPRSDNQTVSAIICFKDKADLTIRCLEALGKQAGRLPLEVLLVNNGSSKTELERVATVLREVAGDSEILDFNQPFNYARMHNMAVERAHGKFLLLLNNDVFLGGTESIAEMVAWAQLPWVATVGRLLRYPAGGVQYGGFKVVFGGRLRLARITHVRDAEGLPFINKEVFGNTFAACVVKKSTYQSLGGLNELELSNGFGDVSFCLGACRRGLHHLYLGHLDAVHMESASRGSTYEYWEECWLEREYPDLLQVMLRTTLGFDQVPAKELSLRSYIRDEIIPRFSDRSYFRPLKRITKAWLGA